MSGGPVNVLRGELSLVGPRPLLPEYRELYSPEQWRRHEMPPGMAGPALAVGGHDQRHVRLLDERRRRAAAAQSRKRGEQHGVAGLRVDQQADGNPEDHLQGHGHVARSY